MTDLCSNLEHSDVSLFLVPKRIFFCEIKIIFALNQIPNYIEFRFMDINSEKNNILL